MKKQQNWNDVTDADPTMRQKYIVQCENSPILAQVCQSSHSPNIVTTPLTFYGRLHHTLLEIQSQKPAEFQQPRIKNKNKVSYP